MHFFVSSWFLLATFAQIEMAIGFIHIFNYADGSLTMRKVVHFANGTTVPDASYTPLAKGSHTIQVDDMDEIWIL